MADFLLHYAPHVMDVSFKWLCADLGTSPRRIWGDNHLCWEFRRTNTNNAVGDLYGFRDRSECGSDVFCYSRQFSFLVLILVKYFLHNQIEGNNDITND